MLKTVIKIYLSFFCHFFFFQFSSVAFGEISKDQFTELVVALKESYPELTIAINNPLAGEDVWWSLDERHASYSQYKDIEGRVTHNIFFFGGLARMSEMTVEGAALILCHELGHGVAGPPLKENSESAVEGQADYFATRFCLPKVLNKSSITFPIPQDPLGVCSTELCQRIYIGIRSEMAVLHFHQPHSIAAFEKIDETVTEHVNRDAYFYPSNQCRLDTLVAGALEQERPRCWWAPISESLPNEN